MTKQFTFDIRHPGEPDAGISSYTDTVTVAVESGDLGGNDIEFSNHLKWFFEDWFDGAEVTLTEVPEQ